MAKDEDSQQSGGLKSVMDALPVDRLKSEAQGALSALGDKAMHGVTEKIGNATNSLTSIADSGGVVGKAAKEGGKAAAKGDNPMMGAVKGGLSGVKDKVKSAFGGGGGGNKATKSTNIIESIDVGVPIDVAYNQWTQFQDFSGFMKKVESVEQQEDEKLSFKAKIMWSHRTWEATIVEQVPNERIIWKSKGEKGHVDGSVTFHELAPSLTRILVVLEYYPQGLFEKTGNIWEAQGRRARAELRHFRRHVMTRSILDEDLEGWRGEIHEGEVERTHDEVVEEEEREDQEAGEDEYDDEAGEDEYEEGEPEEEEGEPEDEYEEGEPEEEEGEPEDEYEEGEPEDEYEDEEPEDEEPEEEYEEGEPEEEEGEPEDEYEDEAPEDEGVDEEEPEEEDDEPEEEYEDEDHEPEEDEVDEEPEEEPRKRSTPRKRR